ncbi:MAG TPA: Hsp20 family protein [Methylobacter sp.]|jgi:HSP20 family molecular chaperone IbpA
MKINVDEEVSSITDHMGSAFDRLGVAINRAFNHVEEAIDEIFSDHSRRSIYPDTRYKISKGQKEVIIEIALPGISPSNISIDIQLSVMKVSWKRDGDKGYPLELTFSISKDADMSAISAKSSHGLLKITVPAADKQSSPVRTIKITSD